MVAVFLSRIWFTQLPGVANFSTPFEKFKYHLIAIRDRSSINAELVCHTYADGPAVGSAGFVPNASKNHLEGIHDSFVSQALYKCSRGERSVWEDKAANITVFVEILYCEEIEAGPHKMMESLIHKYTAHNYKTENVMQGEEYVDDSTRRREINHYMCSVFVYNWFSKDLEQVPDPTFGVHEAIARVDVAEAHAGRAFRRIEAFFKEKKLGDLDSAK